MKDFLSKYYPYIVGFVFVLAYITPFLFLGENAYIRIWDNLDSNVAHYQALKNPVSLAGIDYLPILGGIPMESQHFSFGLSALLAKWLPPYWAIVVNIFLIKLTAFLGLFLLLYYYVIPASSYKKFICVLAALLFAAVPFHEDYGISSAGIPLLFYAFTNLFRHKQYFGSFLLIGYYAFYSSLVLSGWVCGLVVCIVIVAQWIQEKKFPWVAFVGICFFAIIYILRDFTLFKSLFSPGFVSHREEFAMNSTFMNALQNTGSILVHSQDHAGTFRPLLILIPFLIIWLLHFKNHQLRNSAMILAILTLSIFAGFFLEGHGSLPLVRSFQFSRFYFLLPGLCFVLLAEVLYWLSQKGKILGILLVLMILLANFSDDSEAKSNLKRMAGINDGKPGFAQFYDTKLFEQIKSDLSYDITRDRVLCIGMYPSVPEFNGLWTLDSYYQSYPLEYKHRFLQVIEKELEKSEDNYRYFTEWGSRCYLFIDGLDFVTGKDSTFEVDQLDINMEALRNIGGTYILSAVPVNNYDSLGLTYLGSYTSDNSFWDIRVYKL